MTRILLAVNDSPAGLAAARTAVRLARETGGSVRAVYVQCQPGTPQGARGGPRSATVDDCQPQTSTAVLTYVTALADRAGVAIEALAVTGQAARSILDQAATWPADLIVLGRSGVRHVGQPFVGSQVLHVLEFAEVPVVVVPAPA